MQIKCIGGVMLLLRAMNKVCNKTFESKVSMMDHRKQNHAKSIKMCTNFISNACRFKTEACWFSHEVSNVESNNHENVDEVNEENMTESVFQNLSANPKPPFKRQSKQN